MSLGVGVDLNTVITVIGGALAAYFAIKQDIAKLHIKCDMANKAAQTAHKRIDQHIHGVKHEKA